MRFNNAKKLRKKREEIRHMLDEFVNTMAVDARTFFVQAFDKQGFTDQTLDPWAKRKSEKDSGRAILVGPGSGDLKKSIRVVERRKDGVTLGSDLPYAKIHNEGGPAKAWGKWPFQMIARKFMGNSAVLTRRLRDKLKRRIKKLFK